MICSICHEFPRSFWLYGGGYWHVTPDGERLCPGCWFWAYYTVGVRWVDA